MLLEENSWEDMIALNTRADSTSSVLGSAADHYPGSKVLDRHQKYIPNIDSFLANDTYPLPTTKDREGYYADQHFTFWMSGLHDYMEVKRALGDSFNIKKYMDFGAATGRVARHFAAQEKNCEVICADINLKHVRWVNQHLGRNISAFQNHSIPHLPFEDNSFDLITAYSVFSHIEVFDHAWLYEIRRILRPGGVLLFTANVDNWHEIDETWPVYKAIKNHPKFIADELGKPLPSDRRVFRWNNSGSYSSVVFLTADYVENEWGRIMTVESVTPFFTGFQSGVIMRKA